MIWTNFLVRGSAQVTERENGIQMRCIHRFGLSEFTNFNVKKGGRKHFFLLHGC